LPATIFAQSYDEVMTVIKDNNVQELKSILEQTPEVLELKNEYEFPIVIAAAMTDSVEAYAALIEAGADLGIKDNHGRTPLHVAAGWSTLEMVRLIWKHGGDPHAKANKGQTPLDFAMNNFYQDSKVQRGKIVAFLKGEGAQMSERQKKIQQAISEFQSQPTVKRQAGPKPKQRELDAQVPVVADYIREKLRGRKVRFSAWSKVSSIGDKWVVRVEFKYSNDYGGWTQDNRWFYIRDEKVIGSKPYARK